jgi:threonine-phosphate decarboxylase
MKHGGNIREIVEKYGIEKSEIIDFSANINPLGYPPCVERIILNNLSSIKSYPDSEAKELREVLSELLNIEYEKIVIGNGSTELIYLLCKVFSGCIFLTLEPTFSEYETAARNFWGKVRRLQLMEEDEFQLALNSLIRNMRGVDVVFLCNPNNPTGGIIKRVDLEKLLWEAEKMGIFVVVDEAFIDFVPNPKEFTMLSEKMRWENLMVLRSLTKSFALPGLRIGYGIGGRSIVEKLYSNLPPWNVNALALIVGKEVVCEEEFIERTKKFITKEREMLYHEIAKIPKAKPFQSVTNFILVKVNGREVASSLAKKGIIVRDCASFPSLGKHFIRIAIKRRAENLCLINAMREIVS